LSDGTATQETLEAAVAHHRAGRLAEAEKLYREVLARDPHQLRATHNLGAVRLAQRDFANAEAIFARVLALDPAHVQAWGARINALIGANRFEDAEAMVEAGRGRGAEAVAAEVRLRQHWANALLARREPTRAQGQLQRICALTPEDPEAHNDLGRLLVTIGQAEASLDAFQRALDIDPDHAPTLINKGAAYASLRRESEAESCYRQALAIAPTAASAIRNLATLLRAQGRAEEAQTIEASGLAPADLAKAHFARGEALHAADRYEAAIGAFELALRHGADRAVTLAHIGVAQAGLGRYAAALANLDEAVALAPENTSLVYDRALVRLLSGDFAGGWPGYEMRWRNEPFLRGSTNATLSLRDRLVTSPSVEQLAGRRVLAIKEQGVGDQIMFASVLPDLARVAAQTECMCDDRLLGLFANSFGDVTFRPAGPVDAFDAVVPLGSLPYIWRRRVEDFPGEPYLRPGEVAMRRWADRLGPRQTRLRVGLSWRGGVSATRDRQRSMPLQRLVPLLDLADCEFVSLQYGDVEAEVAATNAGRARPVRLFPRAEIDDFEDLAALVMNLDVVVTVQNTLAHLTGAVGAPGLVMIPRVPEWRYGASGETMPWYRALRLFRQGAAGGWDPVIERVVATVRDLSPRT
jgi:tetratricopeptide (TPR) repeat protein